MSYEQAQSLIDIMQTLDRLKLIDGFRISYGRGGDYNEMYLFVDDTSYVKRYEDRR